MGVLRASLRLIALVVVGVPCVATVVLCKPLRLLSRPLAFRVHDWGVNSWARSSAFVLGMRVTQTGTPPEAPFFLVSNHLSYLDILVLGRRLRGHFVAKQEISGWPILGFMSRVAGSVFIDRRRGRDLTRVMAQVHNALDDGRGVLVFPEGTSTKGERVERFGPSIFEVAVQASLAVHTATISYRTPEGALPAHLSVCWWGDMPFGSHFLTLLTLPRIEASLTYAPAPVTAGDRKTLAARAQAQVQASFRPVVGPEAARVGAPGEQEGSPCAP